MAPKNKGLSGLPKPVRQTLAGLQRSLAKSGRQAARERAGDYGLTQSALDAITANLGLGVPNVSTARTQARLEALLARSREGGAAADRTAARLANRYGSASGSVIDTALAPVRARAAASEANAGAFAREGRAAATAAAAVTGIAQAGVGALRASASWAANQALQQRTAIDATTLAQLEAQGWQAVLGFASQQALQESSQQFQREQLQATWDHEAEVAAAQLDPKAQLLVNQSSHWGVDLQKVFNDTTIREANGGRQLSAVQAAQEVAKQHGIDLTSDAYTVLLTIAQKMEDAGAGPDIAGNVRFENLSDIQHQAIMETIGILYPDFAPDFEVIDQYYQSLMGRRLAYANPSTGLLYSTVAANVNAAVGGLPTPVPGAAGRFQQFYGG